MSFAFILGWLLFVLRAGSEFALIVLAAVAVKTFQKLFPAKPTISIWKRLDRAVRVLTSPYGVKEEENGRKVL